MPEGSSQISGRWVTQPLQIALLNMMGSDAIELLAFQKSARVGYTKCLIAAILYLAEHKKRSTLLYQPTDDDGKDFCIDEIDPVIAEMPIIQRVFPDWNARNEKNTVKKKAGIGWFLDILGARTPKNFRRKTRQVIGGDEVDAWPLEVGKEGDPIQLALERLRGAAFPKSIWGSTPTISGLSHVERLVAGCDVRLRFYLPCPHCGGEQHLQWGGSDCDFGIKWDRIAPDRLTSGDVWYECRHCHDVWFYGDMSRISQQGRWVDEASGIWTRDGLVFYDDQGMPIAAPRKVGVYINAIYSLTLTQGWVELVREWLAAVKDPLKLKAFMNTVLGELYDEDSGEKLDHQVLFERREEYRAPVPMEGLYLTCFIDTQDDRFEGQVVAWGLDEESWTVDYFVLYGDLHQPEIWNRLKERLARTYVHETGLELSISCAGMDSGGHFTDEVYTFSKRFPLHWLVPCKGSNQLGVPVITYPRKKNSKGVYLATIGPDAAKDTVYSRYMLLPDTAGDPCPGRIHTPVAPWCDAAYFQQAVAEVKRPIYSKGKREYRYEPRVAHARNEVLDCYAGNTAIMRLAKQHFGLDLVVLSQSLSSIDSVNDRSRTKKGGRVLGGV